MTSSYFDNYFGRIATHIRSSETQILAEGAKLIADTSRVGGRIMLAGDRGSAAMASHVTVDLLKAAKIRATYLT
jgi:D-sedoheptulose 7-phosphate isomerase